jgi:hypothetical protein
LKHLIQSDDPRLTARVLRLDDSTVDRSVLGPLSTAESGWMLGGRSPTRRVFLAAVEIRFAPKGGDARISGGLLQARCKGRDNVVPGPLLFMVEAES